MTDRGDRPDSGEEVRVPESIVCVDCGGTCGLLSHPGTDDDGNTLPGDGCDERCQQQLYLTRQIRLGMNKDVRRIQRLLVLEAPSAGQGSAGS